MEIQSKHVGPVNRTRFETAEIRLAFRRQFGEWRILQQDVGETSWHEVGPHYRRKDELLADLTRYARENWGIEG